MVPGNGEDIHSSHYCCYLKESPNQVKFAATVETIANMTRNAESIQIASCMPMTCSRARGISQKTLKMILNLPLFTHARHPS